MQTTWERETDKKIQKNTVKRRVNELLQREQLSLEERRDKLVHLHTVFLHHAGYSANLVHLSPNSVAVPIVEK